MKWNVKKEEDEMLRKNEMEWNAKKKMFECEEGNDLEPHKP